MVKYLPIKVWSSRSEIQEMTAEFPSYTKWTIGDTSTSYNRIDDRGIAISILVDSGRYDSKLCWPSYEVEMVQLDMNRPIDSSYIAETRRMDGTSEEEFLAALDGLANILNEIRSTLGRHDG